jgi:hypothetical protein
VVAAADVAAAAAVVTGGKVGVIMAAKPESVDAVCSAHPGLIRVRAAASALHKLCWD